MSQAKEAKADVSGIRATIAKKRICAPFAGRLGIRRVHVGQVLAPGDSIVQLTRYDPIFVDFFLPQRTLSRLSRDPIVMVETDAFRGSWTGRVAAIDSEVDPSTRTSRCEQPIPPIGPPTGPNGESRVVAVAKKAEPTKTPVRVRVRCESIASQHGDDGRVCPLGTSSGR